MSPKNDTQKSTVRTTGKASKGFTAEERAAMRARAKELKATTNGENAVREALAAMPPPDRALGERLHTLIRETAPDLTPRTWYGMPAYANDDKVICFFKNAGKFKARYATLGFSDKANLDDGPMWPTEFALKELTPAVEKRIVTLLKKAAS
jgi:uncharacterized protein YdhG (YjbR/CyaY superfamily)